MSGTLVFTSSKKLQSKYANRGCGDTTNADASPKREL